MKSLTAPPLPSYPVATTVLEYKHDYLPRRQLAFAVRSSYSNYMDTTFVRLAPELGGFYFTNAPELGWTFERFEDYVPSWTQTSVMYWDLNAFQTQNNEVIVMGNTGSVIIDFNAGGALVRLLNDYTIGTTYVSLSSYINNAAYSVGYYTDQYVYVNGNAAQYVDMATFTALVGYYSSAEGIYNVNQPAAGNQIGLNVVPKDSWSSLFFLVNLFYETATDNYHVVIYDSDSESWSTQPHPLGNLGSHGHTRAWINSFGGLTIACFNESGIYFSTDMAVTWTLAVLPADTSPGKVWISQTPGQLPAFIVATDEVVGDFSVGYEILVYVSTDLVTWTANSASLDNGYRTVQIMSVCPTILVASPTAQINDVFMWEELLGASYSTTLTRAGINGSSTGLHGVTVRYYQETTYNWRNPCLAGTTRAIIDVFDGTTYLSNNLSSSDSTPTYFYPNASNCPMTVDGGAAWFRSTPRSLVSGTSIEFASAGSLPDVPPGIGVLRVPDLTVVGTANYLVPKGGYTKLYVKDNTYFAVQRSEDSSGYGKFNVFVSLDQGFSWKFLVGGSEYVGAGIAGNYFFVAQTPSNLSVYRYSLSTGATYSYTTTTVGGSYSGGVGSVDSRYAFVCFANSVNSTLEVFDLKNIDTAGYVPAVSTPLPEAVDLTYYKLVFVEDTLIGGGFNPYVWTYNGSRAIPVLKSVYPFTSVSKTLYRVPSDNSSRVESYSTFLEAAPVGDSFLLVETSATGGTDQGARSILLSSNGVPYSEGSGSGVFGTNMSNFYADKFPANFLADSRLHYRSRIGPILGVPPGGLPRWHKFANEKKFDWSYLTPSNVAVSGDGRLISLWCNNFAGTPSPCIVIFERGIDWSWREKCKIPASYQKLMRWDLNGTRLLTASPSGGDAVIYEERVDRFVPLATWNVSSVSVSAAISRCGSYIALPFYNSTTSRAELNIRKEGASSTSWSIVSTKSVTGANIVAVSFAELGPVLNTEPFYVSTPVTSGNSSLHTQDGRTVALPIRCDSSITPSDPPTVHVDSHWNVCISANGQTYLVNVDPANTVNPSYLLTSGQFKLGCAELTKELGIFAFRLIHEDRVDLCHWLNGSLVVVRTEKQWSNLGVSDFAISLDESVCVTLSGQVYWDNHAGRHPRCNYVKMVPGFAHLADNPFTGTASNFVHADGGVSLYVEGDVYYDPGIKAPDTWEFATSFEPNLPLVWELATPTTSFSTASTVTMRNLKTLIFRFMPYLAGPVIEAPALRELSCGYLQGGTLPITGRTRLPELILPSLQRLSGDTELLGNSVEYIRAPRLLSSVGAFGGLTGVKRALFGSHAASAPDWATNPIIGASPTGGVLVADTYWTDRGRNYNAPSPVVVGTGFTNYLIVRDLGGIALSNAIGATFTPLVVTQHVGHTYVFSMLVVDPLVTGLSIDSATGVVTIAAPSSLPAEEDRPAAFVSVTDTTLGLEYSTAIFVKRFV